MTNDDTFFQAYLKLNWADHHVRKAYAIWQGFLKTDFCTISIENQIEGGEKVGETLVVKSTEPLPAELLLSIGDAVHNMRASLDYAVSEILHWKNKRVTFPMGEAREELESSFRTNPEVIDGKTKKAGRNAAVELAIQGLGKFIVDTIRPYKGGHPFLWGLGKIDSTDKHMLLIPVLVPQTITDINTIDDNNNRMSGLTVEVHPGASVNVLGVRGISGFKIQSYGKATAEIFFNEIGIIENEPVFPTLSAMMLSVRETLGSLLEFTLASGWKKPSV